jgi:hypothetical protein
MTYKNKKNESNNLEKPFVKIQTIIPDMTAIGHCGKPGYALWTRATNQLPRCRATSLNDILMLKRVYVYIESVKSLVSAQKFYSLQWPMAQNELEF